MYHKYKGLLSSHAKPSWSFHLSISCGDGKFIFLFPATFCTSHKLWKADFGEKNRWTFMRCYYSKEQIVFFFLLFYRVSRPSDVLIKKKVEKYGKTEFRITVCILGSAPATSQASAFGPMRVAWALMSPALHWILVLSSSRVTLVKLIHSNRMTDSSLFQKLYSFI